VLKGPQRNASTLGEILRKALRTLSIKLCNENPFDDFEKKFLEYTKPGG
jgi:hypothetical protein